MLKRQDLSDRFVRGENASSQKIDSRCAKAMAITTTTSTATSHVTTTQSTTTTLATVPCDELSEAMCCAMSPKRTVERLPGDRPETAGLTYFE